MRVNRCVRCLDFPCLDVDKECYLVPEVEIEFEKVRAIMISEAPPHDPKDYFYA